MAHLDYNGLINMDYKLIFDYYDQPLSFIAKINTNDYLFYYISDEEYFVTLIDLDIAKKLDEFKNLTKLYKYLVKTGQVEIVTIDFKNEIVTYTPFDNYDNAAEYLPKSNKMISFDYEHEIPIDANTNLLQYMDLSTNSYLSVRMVNSNNSHAYPASIIQQIIDYVTEYYEIIKDSNKQMFADTDDLLISSFQKGSFQINFEFTNSEIEQETFKSVNEVIDKIANTGVEPDINFFLKDTNKQLFDNTKNLYEDILLQHNMKIEFADEIKHKKNVISFKPNKFISDNIKNYNEKLKKADLNKESNRNKKITELEFDNAHFLSGSMNKNVLTFVDKNDEKHKAQFDKDLFDEIKNVTNKEKWLTLNVPVTIYTNVINDDYNNKVIEVVTDYKYK
ncbi:hypothetical protein [Lactobacillus apis]|uniref:hypothetical protein n=1 Tax=Lactobacillus apis TaxID=303541 RepID=UPI00164F0991|nr:hypothetical protein [Lactobacillus apis]MBC6361015.1 hypothetical protein [Lactobacillus apis]